MSRRDAAIAVEVLAPVLVPSGLTRVRPWSQAREDYYRLLQMLDVLSTRFHERMTLYIIDPLSLQWVFKVVRHAIRRFPTFLIEGDEKYTGWDVEELSRRIEHYLEGKRG